MYDWSPSKGFVLDDENREVIFSSTNLALIAGPGTGKTEVLAQRACYLLDTMLCPPPHRILALTYTQAAARNLKGRVVERCGAVLAQQFDSYTVHSFANHILTRFGRAKALVKNWPTSSNGYDQMLLQGAALLSVEPISRLYRSAYKFVFLDEFQDMKSVQYQRGARDLHLQSRVWQAGRDDRWCHR